MLAVGLQPRCSSRLKTLRLPASDSATIYRASERTAEREASGADRSSRHSKTELSSSLSPTTTNSSSKKPIAKVTRMLSHALSAVELKPSSVVVVSNNTAARSSSSSSRQGKDRMQQEQHWYKGNRGSSSSDSSNKNNTAILTTTTTTTTTTLITIATKLGTESPAASLFKASAQQPH